jgi:hypothetical protein
MWSNSELIPGFDRRTISPQMIHSCPTISYSRVDPVYPKNRLPLSMYSWREITSPNLETNRIRGHSSSNDRGNCRFDRPNSSGLSGRPSEPWRNRTRRLICDPFPVIFVVRVFAVASLYGGTRRYRLGVRTRPSQGRNTGSIPVTAIFLFPRDKVPIV